MIPLPTVVDIEDITSPRDYFVCDAYHCKLTAGTCVSRQRQARAPVVKTTRGGSRAFINGALKCGDGYLACTSCEDGAGVADALGEVVE